MADFSNLPFKIGPVTTGFSDAHIVTGSRNRINTAGMKWVASQNTLYGQQQTAEWTMPHNCLIGIL
jgi:hypothetical protein